MYKREGRYRNQDGEKGRGKRRVRRFVRTSKRERENGTKKKIR